MAKPRRSQPPPRVIVEPPSAESLGLANFAADEDDAGISLEELGQAYAALLAKGADPYPEEGETEAASVEGPVDAETGKLTAYSAQDSKLAAAAKEETPVRVVDGSDDDACDITPRSILEAILFVGHPLNDPLTSKQIASLMRGVTADEVDDLVEELNAAYEAEGAPYVVRSCGPGYLLQLREEFADVREKFYGRIREARLSQTAIDVLAIVAYNQPISLDEIDRIRSRPSGAILSQLVRRDLLSLERPAEKKARPIYRTTVRFLDLYGLDNLDDLPQVDRSL